MSNDLNIPQLTEGQASPEVTVNDAIAALGDALANSLDIDLTSGNGHITESQLRRNIFFRPKNVATTGRTVTIDTPVNRQLFVVEPASANTNDISLILGSTTVTLKPGRTYLCSTDDTANGLLVRDIGGTDVPNDIAVFVPGTLSNGQLMLRYEVRRSFSVPLNLSGSKLSSSAAATGSTVFTIKKNGSSIGTATIASSGTSATFSVTATSFAVGDVLSIEGPGTADATVADVAFTIKASR